ncbi:ORF6N domain-containing protein [Algoriphagus sp. Y33]|uniref:ORF6N domain-containing protein n=1 Tax=Algoriphagus sp. Y33 TaxID=2772483 RepID=UPI00177BB2A7|nr:ORF6N domain-containing protein [Algoriphagus sp. Y33]
MSKKTTITLKQIENRIFGIRGAQVMIDRDLAEMYEVEVKRLNEQVKRNIHRFPESFRFQLTNTEKNELVANCDRFEMLKHSSSNPYAFTEQGVAMLSAVLRSDTAIKVSIQIMSAFVEMRKLIANHSGLLQRMEGIERKQLETDNKFEQVFKALESKNTIPRQGVFFDGQVFDAYELVSRIIRSAVRSITLIDNYLDESTLVHLSKKSASVKVLLYSKNISKQMGLDVRRADEQYGYFEIKPFAKSHDRFLIIDSTEVYHLGASLKDLGKKWFAFTRLDKSSVESILTALENG